MAFSTQYKELFRVEVLHLYFLNKGESTFVSMNEKEREKQLEFYDYQNFMRIQPTLETIRKLNGHHMIFNNRNTGFSVWIQVEASDDKKPLIDLEDDFYLTFMIKINDFRFYNYSDLNGTEPGELFYFSNRKLPAEPNNFPLINLEGDQNKIDTSFKLSEDGSEEAKREMLSGEKSNLFGVITLFNKADENQLNITTGSGKIPQNSKRFELFFENRTTFWRYIFPTDQMVTGSDDVKVEKGDKRVLVSKKKYPLTQRGFVEVKLNDVELPNPDAGQIKPDAANNKIYSEIYM